MGRLTGFGGRCAQNMIFGHQAHLGTQGQRKTFFKVFFQAGVPLGANTFRRAPHPGYTPLGHTFVKKLSDLAPIPSSQKIAFFFY